MRKIITLTTIPPRLPHMQQTLESLDRQAVDAVYLNLPSFCQKTQSRYELPSWLMAKGWQRLTLNFCDTDYGPASKIIPTLKLETHPDTQILICDDDHCYQDDWSDIYFQHYSDGSFVCGNGSNTKCVEDDLIAEYALDSLSADKLSKLFDGKHYDFAEAFSGLLVARGDLEPERLIEMAQLSDACRYADDLVFAKLLSENGLNMRVLGLSNIKMRSMEDYSAPEWSLVNGNTGGNKYTYMQSLPTLLGVEDEVANLIPISKT